MIDDGFGNVWHLCDRIECGLEVVRPGKVQCWCDQRGGPLFSDDVRCAIRGCGAPASWIAVDHHERIDLCTQHRDLIEDAGLQLIEEDENDA